MESRSSLHESCLSSLASKRLWTSKFSGRSPSSQADIAPLPVFPPESNPKRLPSAACTTKCPPSLLLLYSLPWRPAAAIDVRRRPTSLCPLQQNGEKRLKNMSCMNEFQLTLNKSSLLVLSYEPDERDGWTDCV